MGKAILFVVVLGIAVLGVVLFMSSRAVAPTPDATASPSGDDDLTSSANALRGAVAGAGRKVADGAKAAADKLSTAIGTKVTGLKFTPDVVEVKAGGTAELKVTRIGGDMKAAKLELTPATSSGLKATGGEFKDGQAETTVTIAAPAGSRTDAGLTIKAGDITKVVPVKVK